MNLTLEQLRDDLIVRWKAAFNRLPEVDAEVPEPAAILRPHRSLGGSTALPI